jgi:hypothetical protein
MPVVLIFFVVVILGSQNLWAGPPAYGTVSLLSSAPWGSKRISQFDNGYGGSVAGFVVLDKLIHVGARLQVDRWAFHDKPLPDVFTDDCSTIGSLSATVRLVRTTHDRKGLWPTRAFAEFGPALFRFDREIQSNFGAWTDRIWRGGFNFGLGVQVGYRRSLRLEFVPTLHWVSSPDSEHPYHYFSVHAGVLWGKVL